jgi:murein DD-endopeptidase MepM/ murein hydrolase activator NlpD
VRKPVLFVAVVAALAAGLVAATPASGSDVSEAREAAEEAAQELSDAQAHLGELEQDIAEVQHRHDVAEAEMAEIRGQVETLAVDRYLNAGNDPVVLPDQGDDVNEQLLGNALARFITQGDADVLDEYVALRDDLDASATELDILLAEQEDAVAELEQRNEELQEEVARLEELERQRIEAERRRIEEERQALEAAQELADAQAAAVPSGAGGGGAAPPPPSGGFVCPVPGSTFVDSWGAPRSGGRSHQGVDMMASEGTPIYASVSGTVEHRSVSLGGLSYYLYGSDGNTYFGTHLSGYAAGGQVAAGTVIGYVGSTGNAGGTPHLHFEYHPGGGSPANPYPLVASAC